MKDNTNSRLRLQDQEGKREGRCSGDHGQNYVNESVHDRGVHGARSRAHDQPARNERSSGVIYNCLAILVANIITTGDPPLLGHLSVMTSKHKPP